MTEIFDNIFPKNIKSQIELNQFIKHRILNNCFQEGSCLLWNKSTPYFSIYKKQKHIRQWIYDYCIGEQKKGYAILQQCSSSKVCINYRHLSLVKNGTKRPMKKKTPTYCEKTIEDSDLESVGSDLVSDTEKEKENIILDETNNSAINIFTNLQIIMEKTDHG